MGSYQLLVVFEKSKLGMFKQNLHTSSTIMKIKLENNILQFSLTNGTEAIANKGETHKEENKHLQKSTIHECMYHIPSKKKKKPITSRS